MATTQIMRTCTVLLLLAACAAAAAAAPVPAALPITKPQHKRNAHGFRPWSRNSTADAAISVTTHNLGVSRFEVAPPAIDVVYHNGPVMAPAIRLYIIWYGGWPAWKQTIIRDFVHSISAPMKGPSVQQWWSTALQYTDQTGRPIPAAVTIAGERWDAGASMGRSLNRVSIQTLIRNALATSKGGTLPLDASGGLYMVLSGEDISMQDFCTSACGFHFFTFPSIVGSTLPYGWVGDSGRQCPGTCAYPFAVPSYMKDMVAPIKPPNGDVGVDGLISVMAHEIAETASNPLMNGWYAGNDPASPNEIGDLCEGVYGPGASGSYPGNLMTTKGGAAYNMNGINGRKYLVQWLWDGNNKACAGPNK